MEQLWIGIVAVILFVPGAVWMHAWRQRRRDRLAGRRKTDRIRL